MSPPLMEWESRIGRRVKLRDLYILTSVMEAGSMAKGASRLGMSQPSVSEAIANLEAALRVRLLDRSPRGIEPTMYAQALVKRGRIVFDELMQGMRDIECLADPAVGEVRVGCPESLAGIVAASIERLSRHYPQVVVHVLPVEPAMTELRDLRQRNVDLLLGRALHSLVKDDINVETLFKDPLLVVAGARNPWTRRRKVALSDLMDERWILLPESNLLSGLIAQAFHDRGLRTPRESATAVSLYVRSQLLATGRFLAIMTGTALRQSKSCWNLKAVSVELGIEPLPVAILTLKNRTLSPVVELFIENVRATAKSMFAPPTSSGRRARGSSHPG